MTLFRTAACAAFVVAACPAAAQSSDRDIVDTSLTVGSVVVTGTRLPRSGDEVLTSVDVLGGDLAQRQSVDNTWELFARLPGVTLTDFNQGNTSGRFSIRGFNGEGEINAVKLLIDGIPSNANDGGMVFIDMVMPLDIAAVELVRGTADPRYGLHNIAGNANILTRIGGTYLDARALAGAFGTYEGQVSAGIERGGFSQNYFVGYRQTDGFREHADLRRANLAGKWFYDLGGATVGAIARYSAAKAQEPGYLTRQCREPLHLLRDLRDGRRQAAAGGIQPASRRGCRVRAEPRCQGLCHHPVRRPLRALLRQRAAAATADGGDAIWRAAHAALSSRGRVPASAPDRSRRRRAGAG